MAVKRLNSVIWHNYVRSQNPPSAKMPETGRLFPRRGSCAYHRQSVAHQCLGAGDRLDGHVDWNRRNGFKAINLAPFALSAETVEAV